MAFVCNEVATKQFCSKLKYLKNYFRGKKVKIHKISAKLLKCYYHVLLVNYSNKVLKNYVVKKSSNSQNFSKTSNMLVLPYSDFDCFFWKTCNERWKNSLAASYTVVLLSRLPLNHLTLKVREIKLLKLIFK